MLILIAAIGIVGLLALIETRWPARREPTARRTNLLAWGCSILSGPTLVPLASTASVYAVNQIGGGWIQLSSWPLPLAAIVYTLTMDAGEYAFHRAQHGVPLLWGMHSLHHSDPNMNVTSAVRHFWAEPLLKTGTIWLGVGLLFRPTPEVFLIYSGCYLYHFFEHANLPVHYGRWSWVLNSPAYHRVHHSSDPAEQNTNFAGLFPLFDIVFRTYRRPQGWGRTGLPRQPKSIVDVALWPLR